MTLHALYFFTFLLPYLNIYVYYFFLSFFIFSLKKVAQLVRCRTSNQRVAGSIPGRPGHFGLFLARQFIAYCFSLPSCKMGT